MNPSERDQIQSMEESKPSIVYLSSEDFLKTTLEYENPGGVSAFSVVNNETHLVTIFIDQDIFKRPRLSGVVGNYEDILPFVLEHEIEESQAIVAARRTGNLPHPNDPSVDGHIDNSNFSPARYKAMTSALKNGKLDKYLEFLVLIQVIAEQQMDNYYGRQPKNLEEVQRVIEPYIIRDFIMAQKVRADNE